MYAMENLWLQWRTYGCIDFDANEKNFALRPIPLPSALPPPSERIKEKQRKPKLLRLRQRDTHKNKQARGVKGINGEFRGEMVNFCP